LRRCWPTGRFPRESGQLVVLGKRVWRQAWRRSYLEFFDCAILGAAGSDSRGRQRRKPLSGVNKTDHAHPVNLATNQAKGSGFTTAIVRDP